jgi:uncharacterized membrane protein
LWNKGARALRTGGGPLRSAKTPLFFAGIHPLISGSIIRVRLVASLGEPRYRGLFSLLSLGGLVALVLAYRAAPFVPVWSPPPVLHVISALLMIPAVFFVVAGGMTKGPTGIGREKLLRNPEPAHGVLRMTRHPFLVGTALWAAAHLVALGDAAAMFFFGAFLFLGLTGPARIDRRQRELFGADRKRLDEVTSVVPFLAIIQGRNRLDLREIGWRRGAAAVGVYAFLLLLGHRLLFGVAPLS